jgi:ATP/maltotriose-dependent transcriptional regulator MalT
MLVSNASLAAIDTGEWEWARAEVDTGLAEATSEEERIPILQSLVELKVQRGEAADAELDEVERWLLGRVAEEPFFEAALHLNRATRATQRGDLAAAAAGFLRHGRLDPYNAAWSFGDGAIMATLARDGRLAGESVAALRDNGSRAPVPLLAGRVAEAGIAALEGRSDAARGALLAAFGDLRDLGAVRLQALTGLVMATLLGPGDPRVRAAIDESRRLFERMGAGLWLARLDAALAAGPAVPPSPAGDAPGRTAAPDPAGAEAPQGPVPR